MEYANTATLVNVSLGMAYSPKTGGMTRIIPPLRIQRSPLCLEKGALSFPARRKSCHFLTHWKKDEGEALVKELKNG